MMKKMIDTAIENGRLKTALQMEWVELAYNQNDDSDIAFEEILKLQKGGTL